MALVLWWTSRAIGLRIPCLSANGWRILLCESRCSQCCCPLCGTSMESKAMPGIGLCKPEPPPSIRRRRVGEQVYTYDNNRDQIRDPCGHRRGDPQGYESERRCTTQHGRPCLAQ